MKLEDIQDPATREALRRKMDSETAGKMAGAFKPLADGVAGQKQRIVYDHGVAVGVEDAGIMKEKDMQSACEKILVRFGFHRLTERNLVAFAGTNVTGWFAHWPQAIGNPIMPDLVIWNAAMTRSLCVELKTRKSFRKGQKSAITYKRWTVAVSVDEFAAHVAEWRKET